MSSPRFPKRFLRMSKFGSLNCAEALAISRAEFRPVNAPGEISPRHFQERVPSFLAVQPPAAVFDGVGRHECGAVGILGRRGDHLENSLTIRFGRRQEKINLRAFAGFPVGERGALQAGQARSREKLCPRNLWHGAGRIGIRLRRRDMGQHVKKGFSIEPAVIQRGIAELRELVSGKNLRCRPAAAGNRRSAARRCFQRLWLNCRQSAAIQTGR